jgi:hypothetical protein
VSFSIMATAEFAHSINELIGAGTPVQVFCNENKITNHSKLKAKWKDIRTLEYTDSTTGTKAKLSDDDIEEFMAIVPFKNHLQNELGLKTKNPVDITQYSREDFLHWRYYDDEYDPDNPTQYNQELAQGAEKHEAEMKKLAAVTGDDIDWDFRPYIASTRGLIKDYQERAYSQMNYFMPWKIRKASLR